MNKSLFNLALVLLVVIGFVLFNSTYIVYEGSQGIVTRFGKVVRDSDGKLNIVEPGLHFKAPFIDKNERAKYLPADKYPRPRPNFIETNKIIGR